MVWSPAPHAEQEACALPPAGEDLSGALIRRTPKSAVFYKVYTESRIWTLHGSVCLNELLQNEPAASVVFSPRDIVRTLQSPQTTNRLYNDHKRNIQEMPKFNHLIFGLLDFFPPDLHQQLKCRQHDYLLYHINI